MMGLQERKRTLQDRSSTRHQLVCHDVHAHRWPEFKRMVDEKEAAMLRAFTALEGVNAAGKVELKQIKARSLAPWFHQLFRGLTWHAHIRAITTLLL